MKTHFDFWRSVAIVAFLAACLTGAANVAAQEPATYPYTASDQLGTETVTGTCAGWGLTDPVGASSCATTTITRTASASDLVLTNSGTVLDRATYTASMTITRSAGSVTLALGGATGTARSSSATFTQDFTTTTQAAPTLTFSADFAGTVTTTISVKQIKGWAQYTPNTATAMSDAPDAGAVIPPDAVEAVVSVETYPVRYRYNASPTATVGVLIPAGSVLRWGSRDFAKFKTIRFIDTALGAATINIEYAKGRE